MYTQKLAMIVVAVLMMFVLYLKGRPTAESSGQTALSSSIPAGKMIQITGDVTYPGVYEADDKKMTIGVMQMSKPLCDGSADQSWMQSLDRLQPGNELRIVCSGVANKPFLTVRPIRPSHCLTLGIPLDINRMTEADLELLPGIGPALAGKIIQYRQINGDFVVLEELLLVEGVGEKKIKRLSHYFNIPIQQKKRD